MNVPVVCNLQWTAGLKKARENSRSHISIPQFPAGTTAVFEHTRGLGTENSKPQEQRLFWFAFTWQSHLRVFLTALLLLCSGFFLTLLETAQCCSRTKLPSRPAEATHSPAGCQGQRGRQPEPSSHQPALQEGKPSKCKTILE